MYPIANVIIELCRPQHLTDQNIAKHLSVDLADLRGVAELFKRAGLIIHEDVTTLDAGNEHRTWELKFGHDVDANIAFAKAARIDVDEPIGTQPATPPGSWTQDFVRTGIVRQGPGYFSDHGTAGRDRRWRIAQIFTPRGDQRGSVAAIEDPRLATVSLLETVGVNQFMPVRLIKLWSDWEPG